MQLKPIDSSNSHPFTEASESPRSTAQDGIHPPGPSSLDGISAPRSRRLSRSSVTADTNLSTRGVVADELDQTLLRLSLAEGHAPIAGERIAAYENAATPIGQQNLGFKVTKRSGSPSNGPGLTDCPNGMLSKVPGKIRATQLILFQKP